MAATTTKLVNIAKNQSLRNLIHRELLRAPAVSTATNATPISQNLSPTDAHQFPSLFKSETPALYGMMNLPGIDRSGMFLKYEKNKQRPVSDDDVDDMDGDFDDFDSGSDDFSDDFDDVTDGDDSD